MMMLIGAGLLFMLVVCSGVGTVLWMNLDSSDEVVVPVVEEVEEEEVIEDTGEVLDTDEPEAEPEPEPEPVKVKKKTKRSKRAVKKKEVKKEVKKETGPITVKIRSNGPGIIICGDGSKTRIDGTVRLSFERYLVPVACAYKTSAGNKGHLYINETSEWDCKETAGKVSCTEK
jgi:hypothetical protein